MIRFVDLADSYWFGGREGDDPDDPAPPLCAFIDTVDGRFLSVGGDDRDVQIFTSLEEVSSHPRNNIPARPNRLVNLLPDGFFPPS